MRQGNGFVRHSLVSGWLLAVSFALLATTAAAPPGDNPAEPTARLNAVRLVPQEMLPVISAPPVDLERVTAEDVQRHRDGLPLRFAIPNEIQAAPFGDGRWERVDDATLVWRLRIASPGAASLNIGFSRYQMPEGGRLLVYSSDMKHVLPPFTARDNAAHGELWTPPIPSDEIVLEVTLPEASRDKLLLDLQRVSVGYRGLGEPVEPLSGSCNVDVICPQGVPWRDEIQSVGAISVGGFLTCTGFMVNNTAQDQTPYFMTANHCGLNAGNAASLVVYWNYETSTCGGTPDGLLNTFQSGSFWRSGNSASDFTLVELDEDPDPEWGITFAGWDRTGADPSAAIAIHHPNVDEKRISFENDPLTTTSYLSNSVPGNGTHFRVTDWDEGTTEGGSSGSPLFDPQHRVIGQLHGGYASCSSQTSDWYGKFSVSWDTGGSAASRLKDWLDPTDSGATTLDTLAEEIPSLAPVGQLVVDAGGNGDGIVDPGEGFELRVDVANSGSMNATGVAGQLFVGTPGVSITDGTASWPDIASQRTETSESPHFQVVVGPDFTCGDPVEFTLRLTAAEDPGVWIDGFVLATGTPVFSTSFDDDMESGVNGWTTDTLAGSNPWSQSTTRSNSPVHSWFVADVSSVSDSVLMIPTLVDLGANATLQFRHFLNSEAGNEAYDGGVLEYSTTGGAVWLDAGPLITEGVYNGLISSSYNSPLAGRAAWAGNFGDWRTVAVDLSGFAGSDVMIRWRFATDSSISDEGWYVDDVTLETATFECSAPLAPPGEVSEPFTGSTNFAIGVDPGGYVLSWDAPVAGGPVDEYVLYAAAIATPAAEPACEAILGSGTTTVLPGLSNDSVFVVVARNSAGEGTYGQTSAGTLRPTARTEICP